LDILSPLFQFPLTPNTDILELQERQNALSSIAQNTQLTKALYDFGVSLFETTTQHHATLRNSTQHHATRKTPRNTQNTTQHAKHHATRNTTQT
jgi:hypothetical protein